MRIRPVEEKTLAELLGTGSEAFGDSPIGQRLVEVSRVPLKDMSDWDLAFVLRQRVGAPYLAPVALERLERDIWFDAGLYRGDLLLALLRNRGRFGSRVDLEKELHGLLARAKDSLNELDEIDRQTVIRAFDQEGLPLVQRG